MSEPTLYLFDGYNLLNAGEFADVRALRDELASFVALRGARGVLVFDGVGTDESHGPLEVVYALNADAVLERLAAEHRGREQVLLVSSDAAVRGTSGQEVMKRSSKAFARELRPAGHREPARSRIGDRVDSETAKRLDDLRRRRS